MKRRPKKIWAVGISKHGIILDKGQPFECVLDKGGNYECKPKLEWVEDVGLTEQIGDAYAFASKNKEEVLAFIMGAKTVIKIAQDQLALFTPRIKLLKP